MQEKVGQVFDGKEMANRFYERQTLRRLMREKPMNHYLDDLRKWLNCTKEVSDGDIADIAVRQMWLEMRRRRKKRPSPERSRKPEAVKDVIENLL